MLDRAELWNAVEKIEKRKDSQGRSRTSIQTAAHTRSVTAFSDYNPLMHALDGGVAQSRARPEELAARLNVPPSWVYEKTRTRCRNPIPCLRLGRYVRFDWNAVIIWLTAEGDQQERAARPKASEETVFGTSDSIGTKSRTARPCDVGYARSSRATAMITARK